MPDPKKKKKQSVHPWIQKLREWDEKVGSFIKSTDTYKGLKSDFKKIQKSNKRKLIEYRKRKKQEEKDRWKHLSYKYGGYYEKNN